MALWVALGALILIIAILAGVVPHSITRSVTVGRSLGSPLATDPPPSVDRATKNSARADAGPEKRAGSQRPDHKSNDKTGRVPKERPARDAYAAAATPNDDGTDKTS